MNLFILLEIRMTEEQKSLKLEKIVKKVEMPRFVGNYPQYGPQFVGNYSDRLPYRFVGNYPTGSIYRPNLISTAKTT